MNILDHLLEGEGVEQRETPNRGGHITPRYLVFHFTAGASAQGSIDLLCDPASRVSAHLVLARDGSITQLAPFNVKTWHAGVSQWEGLSGLNSYSIGLEIDNAGRLTRVGSFYRAWFGGEYPEDEVIYARHKNEEEPAYWHAYTEVQMERATLLARLLVREYNLKDLLGHDDIAPGRKNDPGPAFPLAQIRSKVLGTGVDRDNIYRVRAGMLNIRNGPGREFDTVAEPLPLDTRVALIEKGDRWSKVAVVGDDRTTGWVYNRYIELV
ncbi:MAG: N-acetylmuramoyl-L-alanine amidase [Deltaproteobacteria bacterium]|nr:N-acetylmuramoyl-L-alanine amidase [Deltaproteobacteria bacterium]